MGLINGGEGTHEPSHPTTTDSAVRILWNNTTQTDKVWCALGARERRAAAMRGEGRAIGGLRGAIPGDRRSRGKGIKWGR